MKRKAIYNHQAFLPCCTIFLGDSSKLSLLIHLHAVDQPVCNAIDLRFARNEIDATRILLGARALRPNGACPTPAESIIEDNPQAPKEVVEGAASEVGRGSAPAAWIWIARLDVCGHLAVWEVPDLDEAGSPFGGVDAAAGSIEARAVARADIVHDWTAVVSAAVAAVRVANRSSRLAAGTNGHRAAWRGMQRHLVLGVVVHALDDVDLAVSRPICTNHPKGRPRPASATYIRKLTILM